MVGVVVVIAAIVIVVIFVVKRKKNPSLQLSEDQNEFSDSTF